jgi:hypothetical protein
MTGLIPPDQPLNGEAVARSTVSIAEEPVPNLFLHPSVHLRTRITRPLRDPMLLGAVLFRASRCIGRQL